MSVITVRDNLLSPESLDHLNNAKNKSEFVRLAIEYYVSKNFTEAIHSNELKAARQDITEIKNMLHGITKHIYNISTHDIDNTIEMYKEVAAGEDVKIQEENEYKNTNNIDIAQLELNSVSKLKNKDNEKINISKEDIKRIEAEKLLDSSLQMLDI